MTSSTEWYRNNLERGRAQARNSYKLLRDRVFKRLGDKCESCGIMDRRVLQVDHINGGGSVERKLESVRTTYKKIANAEIEIEGYQILCANCNAIKRYTNKEDKRKGV